MHEGPQRISKAPNRVALEPGMIISNEPGYYKTGEYGIRIENLIVVQPVEGQPNMLQFETITLAPIDINLVDRNLLSAEEVAWLNAYHKRVRETLSPQLDDATGSPKPRGRSDVCFQTILVILREGGGSTSFYRATDATRGWSAFAHHDEI